jgi:hypothetical protein
MMTPSDNESGIEQRPQHFSLCHEHCRDQVALSPGELPSLPPAPFAGLVVPLFDRDLALPAPRVAAPDIERLAAPPPRILFCVFRT